MAPSYDTSEQVVDADFLRELETFARTVCSTAGEAVLAAYPGGTDVSYKDPARTDPVTAVDVASEKMIVRAIRSRFPHHAVIGEEGTPGTTGHGDATADAATDTDWEWVVDPLDGTSNFINHIPLFGVSLAVLHRGLPLAAAISLPALGDTYHARAGGGAYRNGVRLRACSATELSAGLLTFMSRDAFHEFEGLSQLRHRLGRTRWWGSAAVELAHVASGSVDYALFGELPVWDVAAGVLLVKEAGGVVLCHQEDSDGASWRPVETFHDPADARASSRTWRRPLLCGAPAAARLSEVVHPLPDPWGTR